MLLLSKKSPAETKSEQPKPIPQKTFFDVIDQMRILQSWWDSMPIDKLAASHDLVAQLFSKKGIIKDKSAAVIYLKKKMAEIGSGQKSEL